MGYIVEDPKSLKNFPRPCVIMQNVFGIGNEHCNKPRVTADFGNGPVSIQPFSGENPDGLGALCPLCPKLTSDATSIPGSRLFRLAELAKSNKFDMEAQSVPLYNALRKDYPKIAEEAVNESYFLKDNPDLLHYLSDSLKGNFIKEQTGTQANTSPSTPKHATSAYGPSQWANAAPPYVSSQPSKQRVCPSPPQDPNVLQKGYAWSTRYEPGRGEVRYQRKIEPWDDWEDPCPMSNRAAAEFMGVGK